MKVISGKECKITQVSEREIIYLNASLVGKNVAVQKPNEQTAQVFHGVQEFRLFTGDPQQIFLDAGVYGNIICPVGTRIEIIE